MDADELADKASEPPVLNVCITGANSPVCHSLLQFLSNGDIFGPDVVINVHLYDGYNHRPTVLPKAPMHYYIIQFDVAFINLVEVS